MPIRFERLISRNVAIALSRELDVAGMKSSVESIARTCVIGAIGLLIIVPFVVYFLIKLNPLLCFAVGLAAAAFFIGFIYAYMEYLVDKRKTKMENMLPDYLQIASANLRSGISLDRALLLAARPEFGSLSIDIKGHEPKGFRRGEFQRCIEGLCRQV